VCVYATERDRERERGALERVEKIPDNVQREAVEVEDHHKEGHIDDQLQKICVCRRECVSVWESMRERESVCMCVCVHVLACVCVRVHECVRVRECVRLMEGQCLGLSYGLGWRHTTVDNRQIDRQQHQ